jgi:hypothetical protein
MNLLETVKKQLKLTRFPNVSPKDHKNIPLEVVLDLSLIAMEI